MKRPTYKSIREAAKKSKRAAIKSGIQKYLYLMSLSPEQVKKLPAKFLRENGCAICLRNTNSDNCPLKLNCNGCIDEWQKMYSAWKDCCGFYSTNETYHKFITYTTKIYLKLLEL